MNLNRLNLKFPFFSKTFYFLTINSGNKTLNNIHQDGTFQTKVRLLHFEPNWNKLVALKSLFLLDVALAGLPNLQVPFAVAVLVGGSNEVQVRRFDGHPVYAVFEGLVHSHLTHSYVHVTVLFVC